jgi:hypothetical protein
MYQWWQTVRFKTTDSREAMRLGALGTWTCPSPNDRTAGQSIRTYQPRVHPSRDLPGIGQQIEPSRTYHDIRDLSKEPIPTPALLLLSRLLLLLLPRPEREPRIDLLLLLLLLPIRSGTRTRSEDAPTRLDRRQGRDRGERVVRVFIVVVVGSGRGRGGS